MAKASSKLGSVRARDGHEGILYEAVAPLRCRRCGRTIEPGERFVRRLHPGDRYKQSPVCSSCVGPFRRPAT